MVESLLPRYLFIRLNDVTQSWSLIGSTRGVTGLIRWGDEVPVVPDEVVDELKAQASDDGCMSIGTGGEFRR
ncbi:MAG: hypothetical protein L0H73_17830 [Nitrococcus sp.]|nr:hypothetical protein [Nitrococcus sp.]